MVNAVFESLGGSREGCSTAARWGASVTQTDPDYAKKLLRIVKERGY